MENLIENKKEAKKKLSKKLSFSDKKPLIGVFLDEELSGEDEGLINRVLGGTSALDIEVIVLADSNLDALNLPHATVLPYGRVNRSTLLNAVDIALCLDFNDVEEMLLHGIIPVSGKRSELRDYNPNHETGNSFQYKHADEWSVFAALVRAVETFKFPYDWKHIVREGRRSVEA